MITITVQGRLPHQPEVKLLGGGGAVCEFRLLSSRFVKNPENNGDKPWLEVTEAVTFFCYGDMAEDFAGSVVTGQEISATGVQESKPYTDSTGAKKTFVRYRLTWFSRGRKPFAAKQAATGQQQRSNYAPAPAMAQRPQQAQRPQPPQGDRNVRQPESHGEPAYSDSGFGHPDTFEESGPSFI